MLFHATPIVNFASIKDNGFKIPDPSGVEGLPSVSFAKRSVASLTHAMHKRQQQPGDHVVIAVRYETLERPTIAVNPTDIHDRALDPAPQIIGVCIIPATYIHV